MMTRVFTWMAVGFTLTVCPLVIADEGATDAFALEKTFSNPPREYAPQAFIERMNANVSKEGMILDIQAMNQVGLSGFHMFDIHYPPKGDAPYGSPKWKEALRASLTEAKRLDLEAVINNCAGWSGSGGTWMTTEHTMYEITWTEKELEGPHKGPVMLSAPKASHGFYRDIAVLAVCLSRNKAGERGDGKLPEPVITASGSRIENTERLSDNDVHSSVSFPKPSKKITVIDFTYPEAVPIRSLHMAPNYAHRGKEAHATLQVSEDGKTFSDVISISMSKHGSHGAFEHGYSFQERRARFFRLLVKGPVKGFGELHLSDRPIINRWHQKGGFESVSRQESEFGHYFTQWFEDRPGSPSTGRVDPGDADGEFAISSKDVIDVTKHVDREGKLTWQVPQGRWLLLRVGYVPTGAMNAPAPKEIRGFACDKLSPAGAQVYMDGFFKNILQDKSGKTFPGLDGIVFDSWEIKAQNWTHRFPAEFKKRRGYDLLPFLPILTGGRIIESRELSERFLWDFRRTIADLIAEGYYGEMARLCADKGLTMFVEGAGKQQFMQDAMRYQSGGDVPMGEFWTSLPEPRPDCIAAASVAHVYGRERVGAEAFTAHPQHGKWTNYPFKLKILGDRAFAVGVNQFQLHRYAHQPWKDKDKVPGMTMGKWGFHYERTLTWWEQSKAWVQYLSRCQYLLQQGDPAADVCYLLDLGAPNSMRRHHELEPALPEGYAYDGCDPVALCDLLKVEDGEIVTPGRARYKLLVLPNKRTLTPKVLTKLAELVKAGATVVGPKPIASPSLTGYPACDQKVEDLAGALWGSCDGKTVTMNRYGKGRVYWTESLAPVFDDINLTPDLVVHGETQDVDIRWIHRKWDGKDIYFLANSRLNFEDVQVSMRVHGKTPRILDPATGEFSSPLLYREHNGRTTLSLRFEPAESFFVVFDPSPDGPKAKSITSISRNGSLLQTCAESQQFKTVAKYVKPAWPPVSPDELGVEAFSPDHDFAEDSKTYEKLIYTSQRYFPRSEVEQAGGKAKLTAWQPGEYTLRWNDETKSSLTVKDLPKTINLDGSWNVHFFEKWGPEKPATFTELSSWSKNSDKNIRYYSGTAAYRQTFTLPAAHKDKGLRSFLDLGRVAVIAEVRLNGKDLGVLWKPPYRVEITDAVKAGKNELEVQITNLWPNRLIGDEKIKDEKKRFTFTTYRHYRSNSPLLESGLLGPVKVLTAKDLEIAKP